MNDPGTMSFNCGGTLENKMVNRSWFVGYLSYDLNPPFLSNTSVCIIIIEGEFLCQFVFKRSMYVHIGIKYILDLHKSP